MGAIQDKPKVVSGLRPLLESLVDYAGLFPPAGLSMEAAVANYARYKAERYSWMLGHFVIPAARLAEFEGAWSAVGSPRGWQLSGLVVKPESDLPLIAAFNHKHAGAVQIGAIEAKAATVEAIDHLASVLPKEITTYVEIPIAGDVAPLLTAVRKHGLRAKIRTGGLTGDLFPEAALVAGFLRAAAESGVRFKATAGLHHPVRCEKPFTYEPDSPRGTMHGFLNMFLAAAFARLGKSLEPLERLLLEEDTTAFHFDEQGVEWRGERLSADDLAASRKGFAIGFGSCSFEEPVADVQALGLLP